MRGKFITFEGGEGAEAEAMLFAAAREDHVRCTIEPALAAGKWVVCDRFADSTRVYQGALGNVDERLIKGLERVSIGDLVPNLTFVLDVPVDAARERSTTRRGDGAPDRFEAEGAEFHDKLRQAFLALAAGEPERCVVVDATVARIEVAKRIWDAVQARLDPATAPMAPADEPAGNLVS